MKKKIVKTIILNVSKKDTFSIIQKGDNMRNINLCFVYFYTFCINLFKFTLLSFSSFE